MTKTKGLAGLTGALLMAAALAAGQAVQAAEVQAPDKVIESVAASFIGALKQEKISNDEAQGKQQIKDLVDEHLSPAIDFRRVAYRTMGKHYRQASTKQFLSFEEAIKKSLINTYSNPLLESNSQQLANKIAVEIRETKLGGKNNDKAVVATWLKVGATEKYDVIYELYLNSRSNKWLAENIIVEGINLTISFRNQFQRLYTEYNGDFDRISQVWAESEIEG